jgi:hypothetical protein
VLVGDKMGWFQSPEEAAERAEAWRPRLITRLTRMINEAQDDHRPYRFEFNASATDKIQGFCFVSPADGAALADAKRRRSFSDEYRREIRDRSDREFESISRGILGLMGCTAPVLTQKSGDQGLDVYGELPMSGRLGHEYPLGGPDSLMVCWVAGQAKKYTKVVEVADIYEFFGAYSLARQGVFHGDGAALQSFTPKPFQPVFLFFLTTGRMTKGAWQLAKRSGLIVLDEPTICALLSDRRVATGAGIFWRSRFAAWSSGLVAQ